MKLGKGSIVTIGAHHGTIDVHTILVVDEIKDNVVVPSAAISSINGAKYVRTKTLLKTYNGEPIESVRLIDGEEFDALYDSKLVAKKLLKDM